jgi:hypothetical protein
MTKRPRVFEQEKVEAQLRELGVPQDSISPTISFMRLLIPLALQDIGVDGLVRLIDRASTTWGLGKQAPGWRRTMATSIVKWAGVVLEEYKDERFGTEGARPPELTAIAAARNGDSVDYRQAK